MLETPERVNYEEWDNPAFIIPTELQLTEDNFLHEAIQVFYKAGGYDFFHVNNPEKYATAWLEFMGGLYADIVEDKYKTDGRFHKNPLSYKDRMSLNEQGVPDIFTEDLDY